jgi:hypothetical protein
LHEIIHIGAAAAHVIKDLITQLEPEAFEGVFVEIH